MLSVSWLMTVLGRVADRSSRWGGCHPERPDRLETWADRNFSKLSKVLQLVRKSPTHQYVQGAMQMERRLVEMDLGVLMDSRLNMIQRGVLAVWNATDLSAALEVLPGKPGVLPLSSALVKSHLKSCIQL